MNAQQIKRNKLHRIVYIYVQDFLTQNQLKQIDIQITVLSDVNKVRIVVKSEDKVFYDKKADFPVPFLP